MSIKKIYSIFRMYWPNILLTFFCVLFLNVLNYYDVVEVDKPIDLTSLNSVLAGFLFTALSVMISALSNEKVALLAKHQFLNKYYYAVYIALILNVSSLVINFIIIYVYDNSVVFMSKWIIYLTMISMAFFMQSIHYVIKLLRYLK